MPRHDEAHILTDKELLELERRVSALYAEARDDLEETVNEYFAALVKRDAHQRELLEAGKITEEQYRQWRLNQIGRGKRFEALRDEMARRYTNANEVALSYVNDATPGIYSLNRNYAAYTIEASGADVSFTLFDEQTVKRLMVEQPDLMPYYPAALALKRGIDLAYGKQQITASVTSGILQGKSIGKIANDLQNRICDMNRASARRAARTAVTAAQNAGRMDSYLAAQRMGIDLDREWVATLDNRTRHAHAMLDGQRAAMDKPFEVDGHKIMFPGDKSAPGYLVYNCRCTIISALKDVDTSDGQRRARDPETGKSVLISDMSYQEWAGWKKKETVANTAQNAIIKASKDLPYTISECTVAEKKFGFGDGTTSGIRKAAEAKIYKTPDGIEFVFPKRYDKTHLTMSPEKAIELYGKVPEKLRKMGQKQIIFNDVYNPQDSYWKKKYKNFPHSYATGGNNINFWRYDNQHNDDYVVRTFCHEIGHKIDKDYSTGGIRFSSYTYWTDAMAEDKKLSGKVSVTKYGANANAEDFAESIAEYVKDIAKFKKEFPNRAKVIDIFFTF